MINKYIQQFKYGILWYIKQLEEVIIYLINDGKDVFLDLIVFDANAV